MPRDLPLGNGSLLVNFDSTYTLRDIYYPYVGNENQTLGHPCRMGVWADGQFAWVGGDGWSRNLLYASETLASDVLLQHDGLGLQIRCNDAVDFNENALVRHFTVKDLRGQARDVRLFFHHDFHLYENAVGDTAYLDPYTGAVIHYKDNRYMLMLGGVMRDGKLDVGLSGYATGKKEVEGSEGTWRDAEDGVLAGNSIAQGSVDSTVQINVSIPANGTGEVYFWLAAGFDHKEVAQINDRIVSKDPAYLIKRTADYWRFWVNKQSFHYGDCSPEVVDLFKRSLLILRTQVDSHGAIIAANDADIVQFASDTYSYMWPRDGALASYALSMAGYDYSVREFLNFCSRVISTHGYFLHKYNPDGSLASSWHPWVGPDGHGPQLPIQEDETALVLWAVWKFFLHSRSVDALKPLFRPLVVAAADFMVAYVDRETGLPQPSYDLWEERHGVVAFTVGALYGGLHGGVSPGRVVRRDRAGRHLRELGNPPESRRREIYVRRAERALRAYGHPPPRRRLRPGPYRGRQPVRSMVLRHVRRGRPAHRADHGGRAQRPLVRHAGRRPRPLRERLLPAGTSSSRSACHSGQPMVRMHDVVCAVLDSVGQGTGRPGQSLRHDRVGHREVPAQRRDGRAGGPLSGRPVSVSPLTWSHAAYVTTVLEYLDRQSELDLCETCGQPKYVREMPQIRQQHARD